jgi:hypothetical protein
MLYTVIVHVHIMAKHFNCDFCYNNYIIPPTLELVGMIYHFYKVTFTDLLTVLGVIITPTQSSSANV